MKFDLSQLQALTEYRQALIDHRDAARAWTSWNDPASQVTSAARRDAFRRTEQRLARAKEALDESLLPEVS